MRYLSVCSGIEAATVAWHPLGWVPAGFAEIDKFPSAVLKHHYPKVPNFGDFTTIKAEDVGAIDLLVGGTPCQSFSIAGLRGGLADGRGNLALEFLRLAQRTRPRWLVWENVPGVLSSNGGRDFGAILGGMVELGYGFAYRVLDAQYFGLAQRRKRVFVVGYLGDWRRAAAVLFERESLSWNPPPRSKAWKEIAGTLGSRSTAGGGLGTDFDLDGGLVAPTVRTGKRGNGDFELGGALAHSHNAKGGSGRIDAESETFVATPILEVGKGSSLRGAGPNGMGIGRAGDPMFTLQAGAQHAVAYALGSHAGAADGDQTNRSHAGGGPVGSGISEELSYSLRAGRTQSIAGASSVRRLTPRECERLQGFPEVRKSVTIQAWKSSEKAKKAALAEMQNRKSQKYASGAEGSALSPFAKAAEEISSTNNRAEELHAALHVRIDLERSAVAIHRAEKLLWSASSVVPPNSSPLPMPVEGFVRAVVLMTAIAVPQTMDGKAASRQSTSGSFPQWSGSACVSVSGQEIGELANDAGAFTTALDRCMRFTTSQSGHNSPNSGRILETLSCCVLAAISSCIPQEIRQGSSYSVTVETVVGYTAIPYRGKAAADGPRYRALGNSMAVPVMNWIGRAILASARQQGEERSDTGLPLVGTAA